MFGLKYTHGKDTRLAKKVSFQTKCYLNLVVFELMLKNHLPRLSVKNLHTEKIDIFCKKDWDRGGDSGGISELSIIVA